MFRPRAHVRGSWSLRDVRRVGDGFEPLLRASLAHHGRPAERKHHSGAGPAALWKPFAGYDPLAAAKSFGERVRSWFPEAFADGPPLPESGALAHLFAGTVALADQIGSDETCFRFASDPDPSYIVQARQRAEARQLRRRDWPARTAAVEFSDLFDYPEPRPLQTAVAEAPLTCPLLVLESETGSGKTEAAVLRFSALWRAELVDGLYFAVPTRAAAKQLQSRVDAALRRLLPPDARAETVLAIPGYPQAGDVRARRVGKFQVEWEDEPDEETRLGPLVLGEFSPLPERPGRSGDRRPGIACRSEGEVGSPPGECAFAQSAGCG